MSGPPTVPSQPVSPSSAPDASRSARRIERLAVLFVDITGSTRLYTALGDVGARGVVDATLNALAAVLPTHGGRVIKYIGDAIMCVFATADQAVMAASAMQGVITEARPGGHRVTIHIGLHFGPVLVEGGDVFGDTVNAASYLCAVAAPEQILITDATEACLSARLRPCVRPVFFAVLKGGTSESTIYQIVWQRDKSEITDVNLRRSNIIPADMGGLILTRGEVSLRVDQAQSQVSLGRSPGCNIAVADRFASRHHAIICVRRTHYFLTDFSINGTFVRFGSGAVLHVLKSEVLLDGSGTISLGRGFDQEPAEVIAFARDRRALYRV